MMIVNICRCFFALGFVSCSLFGTCEVGCTVLILSGPSSSGKTTAAGEVSEKLGVETFISGFDLLSEGEEGDQFANFLYTHPIYKEIQKEFSLEGNLFSSSVRLKLNDRDRELLEAKFEEFVEVRGALYKNQRLIQFGCVA